MPSYCYPPIRYRLTDRRNGRGSKTLLDGVAYRKRPQIQALPKADLNGFMIASKPVSPSGLVCPTRYNLLI
ncbi:MAG: hypothetical protein Q7U57_18970 [Methylovulum sp.]|nr:hypothetical protein [Methylovulum sp.]